VHLSLNRFLIRHQAPEQARGRDAVEWRDRAVSRDGLADRLTVLRAQMPRRLGQPDRGLHSEGDGLSVQEA